MSKVIFKLAYLDPVFDSTKKIGNPRCRTKLSLTSECLSMVRERKNDVMEIVKNRQNQYLTTRFINFFKIQTKF
jgi:hypothetical protein